MPLSAPKIHRSNILLLYVWIHPSHQGQSLAKVTESNSKYSQSYNHAKFLIIHVRWQCRCQHPKFILSNVLLLYASIHPSYQGQSLAKVTGSNSKYSQSYNHAKILILHVRWQSRCQHLKITIRICSCCMHGFTHHTLGNHLPKLQLLTRNIHRVTIMQRF